jgi:hypothetical protein
VRALRARVSRFGRTGLCLDYELDGECAALLLPKLDDPLMAHELWRHSCFEAFIAPAQGECYFEFNFSPSRAWACYRFESYRDGDMRHVVLNEVEIDTALTSNRYSQRVTFDCPLPLRTSSPLRLGLCAVIETRTAGLSYWALTHSKDKPDFHDRAGWLLELE